MRRLAIVGGGISGLAAAEGAAALADRVPGGLEVIVLEKESQVGGKALSVQQDGWLVECGPTGFLDNEPALDRLVEAAGLEKLPASTAAARRFVVRGSRMREIHAHPLRFARAGILGPFGLARMLLEPVIPRRRSDEDESVWSFAARRLGAGAADRMIAPMVLGVFAGDAKKLSLEAAFPKLHTLEREHGSLVRGMIAKRRQRNVGGPAGPSGTLTTFRDGLQSLPRALAAGGRYQVRGGVTVRALARRAEGGLHVDTGEQEPIPADAVVLAGEPWAMAPLVSALDEEAGRELGAIYCPPVVVVALGFGPESLQHVPQGFGVLIPRGEGMRILGCLWDTFLFEGRSPERHLLLRVMLGGAVDPEVGTMDEDSLVQQSRDDLARLLGLTETPVFKKVIRWPQAIPQYELGHLRRVALIEAGLGRVPGLYMAGNALHGVAFGKAAAAGLAAGEKAGNWLAEL